MTATRSPIRVIPRAFPGIKAEEVEDIIAQSRIKEYPAGSIICHEDAIEHTFYMILSGDLEVTKDINKMETRLLKMLTAEDFFGEMALIDNAPRAATVTAKTDVVALELDKEGFQRIFQKSPSVAAAMVREISGRLRENDKMAIEDLRQRAEQLSDAYEKLARQDHKRHEFLTTVAHELRTPLFVAGGYLQLLQRGAITGERLTETVDVIARNIARITQLVNDILFLQEIELVLPEFSRVNIAEIVQTIVAQYKEKAESKGVNITVKGGEAPITVSGDAKTLERAVMALVDNAIKFSPRGGDVEARLETKDSKVFLTIADHGIGIAPEVLPNIFDRFYHLEKSGDDLFGGLGLGLSITRQVIQQHKGELDVTSEVGKGSAFTITLNTI